jgi:hypothetical protein
MPCIPRAHPRLLRALAVLAALALAGCHDADGGRAGPAPAPDGKLFTRIP